MAAYLLEKKYVPVHFYRPSCLTSERVYNSCASGHMCRGQPSLFASYLHVDLYIFCMGQHITLFTESHIWPGSFVVKANVYHASTATGDELAVKVYKTSILVFKYVFWLEISTSAVVNRFHPTMEFVVIIPVEVPNSIPPRSQMAMTSGIEKDTFKETFVLDTAIRKATRGRWSKPGPRKRCEISRGRTPNSSIFHVNFASFRFPSTLNSLSLI